ncbi:peptide chain release factor 3 [Anopheles sinensis]|uniref:Peptide chain release factor 3 n=1 Tax=Anopheles sinensis TaxID=74873 RepID=A0A084WLM7_ANOSI|nr:peptide chain release factor 3 [Anopheles sinensis]
MFGEQFSEITSCLNSVQAHAGVRLRTNGTLLGGITQPPIKSIESWQRPKRTLFPRSTCPSLAQGIILNPRRNEVRIVAQAAGVHEFDHLQAGRDRPTPFINSDESEFVNPLIPDFAHRPSCQHHQPEAV